jgi:nicotinamide riboside kinase
MRSIYVVGAQCTGKTSLVKALEDHFNNTNSHQANKIPPPKIIKETARVVLKQHNFTADDITSSPARALALQQLILQAQVTAESASLQQAEWIISDRSGADPIVYTKKYVSEEAADGLLKSAEWLELKGRMAKSTIVVCEAGADWLADDGVRLMPGSMDDWIGFHQLFCRCLDEWDLKYEILLCDITSAKQRVEFVLEKWQNT